MRRSEAIERGEILIHSEEEWRQRLQAVMRRGMRWATVLVAIVTAVMVSPLVLTMDTVPDGPRIVLPLVLVIVALTMGTVPLLDYTQRWQARRCPAVGLYERGVQLTVNLFVPYHEIEGVEPVRRWVRIHPRFQRTPFPGIKVPGWWAMSTDLLGDDGQVELDRRVRGLVEDNEGPPRLVIYGRRL